MATCPYSAARLQELHWTERRSLAEIAVDAAQLISAPVTLDQVEAWLVDAGVSVWRGSEIAQRLATSRTEAAVPVEVGTVIRLCQSCRLRWPLPAFGDAPVCRNCAAIAAHGAPPVAGRSGSVPLLSGSAQTEIARRYAAGESPTELAREYGVVVTTIRDYVRRAGGTLRGKDEHKAPDAEGRYRCYMCADMFVPAEMVKPSRASGSPKICLACQRARNRAHYERNREALIERVRANKAAKRGT